MICVPYFPLQLEHCSFCDRITVTHADSSDAAAGNIALIDYRTPVGYQVGDSQERAFVS